MIKEKSILNLLAAENIDETQYFVAVVDGAACKTQRHFLKEMGKVFKFSAYYGQNFNALSECLSDLEWLAQSNYFLIVTNSKDFLKSESVVDREHTISLLDRISKEWSTVPNYEGEDIYSKKADFKIKWS